MMARFFKYILSLSVLMVCLYSQSYAIEMNESHSHLTIIDSASHIVSVDDVHNDFPFTELTNTHQGRRAGLHPTAVEAEVDDEVRVLANPYLLDYNFISSNFSTQIVGCFLSFIEYTVPTYSYRANFSRCWYILFRVFRL